MGWYYQANDIQAPLLSSATLSLSKTQPKPPLRSQSSATARFQTRRTRQGCWSRGTTCGRPLGAFFLIGLLALMLLLHTTRPSKSAAPVNQMVRWTPSAAQHSCPNQPGPDETRPPSPSCRGRAAVGTVSGWVRLCYHPAVATPRMEIAIAVAPLSLRMAWQRGCCRSLRAGHCAASYNTLRFRPGTEDV